MGDTTFLSSKIIPMPRDYAAGGLGTAPQRDRTSHAAEKAGRTQRGVGGEALAAASACPSNWALGTSAPTSQRFPSSICLKEPRESAWTSAAATCGGAW